MRHVLTFTIMQRATPGLIRGVLQIDDGPREWWSAEPVTHPPNTFIITLPSSARTSEQLSAAVREKLTDFLTRFAAGSLPSPHMCAVYV